MTHSYRLDELAERFGLTWHGDAGHRVDGVCALERAGTNQLAFLANPKLRPLLATSSAGIVVLDAASAEHHSGNRLLSNNPHASFARIAALFEPATDAAAGIHPSAVVEVGAQVAASASIGPFCHVTADAVIGEGVTLGSHCRVGPRCHIGAGSRLVGHVCLVQNVTLGQRVLIHPGAVLGSDGFGLAFDQGAWLKVPQLGGVRVGDDCEIGANTSIDRGALDDTVLEDDVRLDNQIQIAHNVYIGAHTAVAGCVGIAGSAKIGRYCLIAGKAGIAGHLEICDRVTITAMSMVSHSIREPGEYSSGIPVQEGKRWRRTVARLRRLDRPARSGGDAETNKDEQQ